MLMLANNGQWFQLNKSDNDDMVVHHTIKLLRLYTIRHHEQTQCLELDVKLLAKWHLKFHLNEDKVSAREKVS